MLLGGSATRRAEVCIGLALPEPPRIRQRFTWNVLSRSGSDAADLLRSVRFARHNASGTVANVTGSVGPCGPSVRKPKRDNQGR